MRIVLTIVLVATLLTSGAAATERQQVLGFGGVFFKAENPAGLATWYEQHLGVKQTPRTYEEMPWQEKAPH